MHLNPVCLLACYCCCRAGRMDEWLGGATAAQMLQECFPFVVRYIGTDSTFWVSWKSALYKLFSEDKCVAHVVNHGVNFHAVLFEGNETIHTSLVLLQIFYLAASCVAQYLENLKGNGKALEFETIN